ncbi:TetR/AcrR family transcriptional regulator [Eubacteriales bacterium DFI.9.88]|nr:TetR/AcrR family transcriptional regulator [Eubacteriales bacterium DFI.9.88]
MGRENKKEAVAALHREQIMKAAETLFAEKGYIQTTIDDISKLSEYSRRTIYSYYESKEDILYHIIEKGLVSLKANIETVIKSGKDFVTGYKAICIAMSKYQAECPQSMESVNSAKATNLDFENISDTVKHILTLGTEINSMLAGFIENGKKNGVVREDVIPLLTVYVLWSSITSLLDLTQTKGTFIAKQFSISENDFLEYGFKQIINSILEVRI